MPRRMSKYDAALQMFVADEPRELNMDRVRFLRWLGENRRLEHPIAGPSSGPLTDPPPDVFAEAA